MSVLGDVFWSRDGETERESWKNAVTDESHSPPCFPASKKKKKIYMYIIDLSHFGMERCRWTENCCDERLSHILHHPTTFFCSPETKHCRFWSILLEFNKQATFFATLSFCQEKIKYRGWILRLSAKYQNIDKNVSQFNCVVDI